MTALEASTVFVAGWLAGVLSAVMVSAFTWRFLVRKMRGT